MELDLARLRAFVATADERSFTRAAQVLGIAQPSLSERVRRLEDELGVPLFSRQRRQITLTAAGVELLRRARPLLTAADQAVAEVRAAVLDDGRSRRMAVTTMAAGVDELKAGIVLAVRAEAPELAVTLTAVPISDHVRVLHDGRADAAFVWPPYRAEDLADLHVEPVREESRLLAVPAGHPVTAAGGVAVDDIAALPQLPLRDEVDPVFVAAWRLVTDPPLAAVPPVDTVTALLDAVAAGHGCCPVPALLARTALRPDVAFVPMTGVPPATLALAWRRDDTDARHRLLRRLVRALREARPPAAGRHAARRCDGTATGRPRR